MLVFLGCDSDLDLNPLELALRLPVLLLALTVHEFAHAYAAYRLGDPTAYRQGRCTLNPLAHLDPLGTICLIFAPIGWAKPVPVNPYNLRHPQRDDILISAAGPVSNLLQAFCYALVMRFVVAYGGRFLGDSGLSAALLMCWAGIMINSGLAVFNMIPAYPLDGFHVFSNLAKGESRQRMLETARFGPMLIIFLVVSGRFGVDLLGVIMNPFISFFVGTVAGLPNLV